MSQVVLSFRLESDAFAAARVMEGLLNNALPPHGERPTEERKVERLDEFKRKCEVCGQVFDTRDQEHVFHHDANPHEPLTRN
jgi:hypothetical protein